MCFCLCLMKFGNIIILNLYMRRCFSLFLSLLDIVWAHFAVLCVNAFQRELLRAAVELLLVGSLTERASR